MAKKTVGAGGRKMGGGARKRSAAKKAASTKSAQIRARIDPDVKRKAERILEDLGLNPSSAISTFYRQIVLRRGLPFPVEVPNAETKGAIEDARAAENLIEADDIQDLLSKLLTKRERSVDVAHLTQDERVVLEALLAE